MFEARAYSRTPVTREMADYTGYRDAVGGGAAFFLGLLTAGLYPGLAVITRLRRHRADKSQLFFHMVDQLRQPLGSPDEVNHIEALADRMRRKAARGVLAILAAVAVSLVIVAAVPAVVVTYNAFSGYRVGFLFDHEYRAEDKMYATGAIMGTLAVGLLIVWAVLALSALAGHRRRTTAILTYYNMLAQQQKAPRVRIYPAGLTGGQPLLVGHDSLPRRLHRVRPGWCAAAGLPSPSRRRSSLSS